MKITAKILTISTVIGTGISLLFGSIVSAVAAIPNVPRTNEVVRYERVDVSPSRTIPREWGDALLSALDGGRQLAVWSCGILVVIIIHARLLVVAARELRPRREESNKAEYFTKKAHVF